MSSVSSLSTTSSQKSGAMLRVWLISLAHGINDMYCEYLATFTPYLKQTLGLDYAASGALNVIMGVCYVLVQPLVGYFADKMRRPWLIIIGPIMASFGAVMISSAKSYTAALFFVGIWGAGSAIYHPQGSGSVGYVAPPDRLPAAMTIFNMFGSAASMLSPLVAVFMVSHFGYDKVWLSIFPTLVLAPIIYFAIPVMRIQETEAERTSTNANNADISRGTTCFAMFLVCMIAFLRDFVLLGVRFTLPLKISFEGGSLGNIGTVLFFVTLGEILLMLPAVKLSGKFGFKPVYAVTIAVSALCYLAATAMQGFLSVALYALGTAFVFATAPLTVVLAQSIMPKARSAASSLVTGLPWGLASVALYPLGVVADWIGISTTLVFLSLIPLLMLLPFLSSTFRAMK